MCSEARFRCRNGRCVDRSFLCNGQDNCQDNSDEELCLSTVGKPSPLIGLCHHKSKSSPPHIYMLSNTHNFALFVSIHCFQTAACFTKRHEILALKRRQDMCDSRQSKSSHTFKQILISSPYSETIAQVLTEAAGRH